MAESCFALQEEKEKWLPNRHFYHPHALKPIPLGRPEVGCGSRLQHSPPEALFLSLSLHPSQIIRSSNACNYEESLLLYHRH